MGKMVGVDVDGVVCDIHSVCIEYVNNMFGMDYVLEDITSWDLPTWPREHFNCFMDAISNPDSYGLATEIENSKFGIHELNMQGYLVVYITSCMKGTEGIKFEWLREHKYNPEKRFYFETHNKNSVSGVDYLIDDGPHNITDFKKQPILFDQPWNRNYDERKVPRANWNSMGTVLHALQKETI